MAFRTDVAYDEIKPSAVYQVLDADSSQLEAIQASKQGESFVLQGPPGTGKSQTIANIISEALADGKKILFVSEKRAALEVVYKRLQNAQLSDFCLSLHNYRTNRREVLEQLEKVLDMSVPSVPRSSMKDLEQLLRQRTELNRYPQELHTETSGLNESVYSIIGKLSQLAAVADILCDIPNPSGWKQEQLDSKCALLNALASHMGECCLDYQKNAWHGSKVMLYTQALAQDIDSKLPDLSRTVNSLHKTIQAFSLRHGISCPHTLEGLLQYKEICSLASKETFIPAHWVKSSAHCNELDMLATQWGERAGEYRSSVAHLATHYVREYLGLVGSAYEKYLLEAMTYLQKKIKANSPDELAEQLETHYSTLQHAVNQLEDIFVFAAQIAPEMSLPVPTTRKELLDLFEVSEILTEDIYIPQNWLDPDIRKEASGELVTWRKTHDEANRLESSILESFDKEILTLDFMPILRRFRREYTSFWRVFKSGYHRDVRTIRGYYHGECGLKFSDILSVLNQLKKRSDIRETIQDNRKHLETLFGHLYEGMDTQWDDLKSRLERMIKITHIYTDISSGFQALLEHGGLPLGELSVLNKKWKNILPVEQYNSLNNILIDGYRQDSAFSDIRENCRALAKTVKECSETLCTLSGYTLHPLSYTNLISDLHQLVNMQTFKAKLEADDSQLRARYAQYYAGIDTDWDFIHEAAAYARNIAEMATKYSLPSDFVAGICTDTAVKTECHAALQEMDALEQRIGQDIIWFTGLFHVQGMFRNMPLNKLSDRIAQCSDNKQQLQQWIDYQRAKQACKDADLDDFINQAEQQNLPSRDLSTAYRKRFFTLWLDAAMAHFDAIHDFRAESRQSAIDQFRELDVAQFQIAKNRIRRILLAGKKKYIEENPLTLNQEIRTLRRELHKKSRLMPMRRLLGEIPQLALLLKPCFMMSPLSVSIFLGSSAYNHFDLVVFDEASQVRAEDAVGAIMRGKQVIIVGDDKQLPPTNFFRTTLSDQEDDPAKDDYYDGGSFESILSEARGKGFKEHSLLWHYRSRHEHLIAFSNLMLYGGKLITFPSAQDKIPDVGVEYIKVEDGVYEKGVGINAREAERVVDLIFEHCRKFNGANRRSLGVVTFSDSQQEAITSALNRRRRLNRSFERFFDEDADEPFFIKNLENVQGDERDTMIFSICYARNSEGKLYMNFGPLNSNGGERRLNVAITRAKYNVKLVGSIEPEEIKSETRGVALLRAYIKFAQLGLSALDAESSEADNSTEEESPFESSVRDFLESNGYAGRITSQVGCSGYRIDLAVNHPTDEGKYVLGIECDGATYHSAKTARERDRLRQTVLEDMGWKIYRIWSTDWIRARSNQEKKLLAAIRQAEQSTA